MMTPEGLRPARYDSSDKDGKKNSHVVIDYTPGMVTAIAQPAWRDFGFPPATLEQKLEARDPLSALVQLVLRTDASRRRRVAVRCEYSMAGSAMTCG